MKTPPKDTKQAFEIEFLTPWIKNSSKKIRVFHIQLGIRISTNKTYWSWIIGNSYVCGSMSHGPSMDGVSSKVGAIGDEFAGHGLCVLAVKELGLGSDVKVAIQKMSLL